MVMFTGHRDAASVLKSAAEQACKASGMDRAMVFRLDDGHLLAMSTHFVGRDEWAAECQARAEHIPIHMVPGVLETEIVRRRLPALVSDPLQDPQAYQPIVGMIRTPGYVASPILVNGQIAATLHLDVYDSARNMDTFDRDIAADLAASIGHALERTVTLQQLMRQREILDDLARQTEAHIRVLSGTGGLPRRLFAELSARPEPRFGASVSTDPATHSTRLVRSLTRREAEVLQLMSTGATNADIASSLVVAEGTIKTHVKRILRKLNAGNRGQAVAHYTNSVHSVDQYRQ
ncbi:MAG: LuxR C-terminal-related transcriptional regulator [Mycobacterium sp.]